MSLLDPIIGFGAKQRDAVNAKRFYKHRYRWAMDDMKKAGLNPILTAAQGIAGNFSGTSGSVGSTGNISDAVNKTATTVMSAKRLNQELSNMRSSEQLTNGLYQKSIADRINSVAAANQADQASAESKLRQIALQLDQPRLKHAANHAEEMGIWGPRIDRALSAVPAIASGVGAFIGGRIGRSQGAPGSKNQKTTREQRARDIENQPRRN